MTIIMQVWPGHNATRSTYYLDPDRWPGYMRAILHSVERGTWTGNIPGYVVQYLEKEAGDGSG